MNFFKSIKSTFFSKYANFSGRATRFEFWSFVLFYYFTIFTLKLPVFTSFFGNAIYGEIFQILVFGTYLITVIPYLAVSFRRLHDANISGWWSLLPLIPRYGSMAPVSWWILVVILYVVISIVFYTLPSDPKKNKYGPSIKFQKKILRTKKNRSRIIQK